jgi:hypothetical protein
MAFHVEISVPMRHARVFNLDREDLIAKVVEPWLANRKIEMGDREWVPEESSLRILEGPHMEPPDLSFGQGWANAERKSDEVTRELLAAAPRPTAPDAFLIEAESPDRLVAELLGGHGARPIEWREAQAGLDGRDPEVAAVILVTRKPDRPPPEAGSEPARTES